MGFTPYLPLDQIEKTSYKANLKLFDFRGLFNGQFVKISVLTGPIIT